MSKHAPIKEAADLLHHLMPPLCRVLESGRNGHETQVQMHGQSVVQVLDTLGFHKEAKKIERIIQ